MRALAPQVDWLAGDPAESLAGFPASLWRWLIAAVNRIKATTVPARQTAAEAGPLANGYGDGDDIQASLQGDGDAYARLVRRYQGEIGAYMWRFTRQQREWEELVHDVFVEAYLSLGGYAGRAPLAHWLRRIATRVGYRWWKRRSRLRAEAPLPLADWDRAVDSGPSECAARDAGELVHAVLARMSSRDRLVLTLLYLEGCSVAQAAELAGWSQTMVKVQAHRARKRLQKLLEEEHPHA